HHAPHAFPTRRSSDLWPPARLVTPPEMSNNAVGPSTTSTELVTRNMPFVPMLSVFRIRNGVAAPMLVNCKLLTPVPIPFTIRLRSEEHTSELQSPYDL